MEIKRISELPLTQIADSDSYIPIEVVAAILTMWRG